MYRKFAAGLLALLLAMGFFACGNGGEGSSEPSEPSSSAASGSSGIEDMSGASSDSSSPASGADSSDPSEPAETSSVPEEEGDTHTVILCNGTGSRISALRVREEGSEYWSFEILGGEAWPDGSSIELDLSREEWDVDGGWEVEVTLDGGSTAVYTVPLGDYGIVELRPDGAFEGE